MYVWDKIYVPIGKKLREMYILVGYYCILFGTKPEDIIIWRVDGRMYLLLPILSSIYYKH